ncbi:hypothetical protein ACWDUL_20500 [Nocardia niigatensis]
MVNRHPNLTAAISDTTSPLRCYLDQRFPNRRWIQDDYRAASGTIRVPPPDPGPASAAAGTLGAAFDFMIRASFPGQYRPGIAAAAPPIARIPRHVAAVHELARHAGLLAHRPLSDPDVATAARAAWGLALCTELFRSPLAALTSPLPPLLRGGDFTLTSLMALAPEGAVEQLHALYLVAIAELADILATHVDRVALGPTFAASRLCAADADLIVDRILVELKVRRGKDSAAAGHRTDRLSVNDLYQIVGYILFDTNDSYRLDTVVLYSARFGHLHRWPIRQLLDTLAGTPVDIAHERAQVWRLLDAPPRVTP